jgi:hypothetical protein
MHATDRPIGRPSYFYGSLFLKSNKVKDMPRKKIEFTEEMNVRIAQLVEDGKSLQEIVDVFNTEFGTSYVLTTIYKQVKVLGIVRKDKRGETKIDIDPDTIIKLMANYESVGNMARKLKTSTNAIKKNIKRHKITYQTVKEYKNHKYFDIPSINLITLKGEVLSQLDKYIQERVPGFEVLCGYTLKYNNTDVTVDFYCPELDLAFVCSTIDDHISKRLSDRVEIIDVVRWSNHITSNCSSRVTHEWRDTNENDIQEVMCAFGDGVIDDMVLKIDRTQTKKIIHYEQGLKVFDYTIVLGTGDNIYDIQATADKIIGQIKSIAEKSCIEYNVDFEDPMLVDMKKMEVVTKESVYVPGALDDFNDFIKVAKELDKANYEKELEKSKNQQPVYVDWTRRKSNK